MDTAVACTIVARNYLAHTHVFTESFLKQHPNGKAYVLLVDKGPIPTQFTDEQFIDVWLTELDIPDITGMIDRYTIRELCTAVKPYFLEHLLLEKHEESVVFFDPDIYIYQPLSEAASALKQNDVVLTPHLYAPLPDDGHIPNELSILAAGTFNLGFIGIRKSPATLNMLRWWQQRLVHFSHGAPHRQEHFDQRWIDLVPGFMNHVHVLHNPGYNAAYWNVANHAIQKTSRGYMVDNHPLTFFHFSGFNPLEPQKLSKHQNRISLSDQPVLAELCQQYAQELLAAGFKTINTWQPKLSRIPAPRVFPIEHTGSRIYRWLTTTLADLGLEEILGNLLGERFIASIRNIFWWGMSRSHTPTQYHSAAGVDVWGFFELANGVGQASRAIAEAIKTTSLPTKHYTLATPRFRAPIAHHVQLVCANADVFPVIHKRYLAPASKNQHIIGYWWWETELFPNKWLNRFALVDELWVGTTFIQKTLQSVTNKPVHVLGVPIETTVPKENRGFFGIPTDDFTFLTIVDLQSYMERKNPLATIAAFKAAFPNNKPGVRLVIKIRNAKLFPRQFRLLQEAAGQDGRIQILDIDYSVTQLTDLIAAADTYISLHRSEGFGLPIAQAMSLGKPVIATGYSGNMDYMNVGNSFPIDYTLVPLKRSVGPYERGTRWAEPSLEHAASTMRFIYENRDLAQQRGERAADEITSRYSPEKIGHAMEKRIREIYNTRFSEESLSKSWAAPKTRSTEISPIITPGWHRNARDSQTQGMRPQSAQNLIADKTR